MEMIMLMSEKITGKDMVDMDLHTSYSMSNLIVMRVPGGWIYSFSDNDSCFVPLDNEFIHLSRTKEADNE